MNPLSLTPAKYKAIAIGIAILAAVTGLLWVGHHYGAQGVQAEWDRETAQRKQAENAAILARIDENNRKAEQDKLNSARIAQEHKNEMDKVRADLAAQRLRKPKWCAGSTEGAKADSASSSNAAYPASRALPAEVERDIRGLIEETERAAATGRACQEFVRSNGMTPE
jgi:ABC-type nitrate/sulfonate/bicarbonate transport system substrate-binding protein